MKLVKSDILSFGVLLLRLFFRRSAQHDDRTLIEWVSILLVYYYHDMPDEFFIFYFSWSSMWHGLSIHKLQVAHSCFTCLFVCMYLWQAQPLLLERALPELLDEGSEDVDVHGIYRAMYSAYICTRTCPDSRPCMSKVVNLPSQYEPSCFGAI